MLRRLLVALAVIGLTSTLAACGSTLAGTPGAAEVDVRKLDTGSFPVEPRDAHGDYRPSFYSRKYAGAMRLADYVATAYDIDPHLKYGGLSSSFTTGTAPDELGPPAETKAIAERNKMLFGFISQGSDPYTSVSILGAPLNWPRKSQNNSTTIATIVMQFPDSGSAERTAQELYEADLNTDKEHNRPVALPKYPRAHALWQPGSPFIRATMAHGSYVATFLISTTGPDLTALTALTEKAYDTQVPLLDQLTPLSDEETLLLPWDPDGLLNRALNPDKFWIPSYDDDQAAFGVRGAMQFAKNRDRAKQAFTAMGAEKLGLSYGTIIVRTTGPEAAKKTVTGRIAPFRIAHDTDSPPNVPDTACVENRPEEFDHDTKRFTCIVAYHEYVALVSSNQLLDTHQRAAAQYALFANSR